MKVLEFETSKGKFKLIDMPETIRINGWNGAIMIDEVNQISQEKYDKGFYLKNITEEQASEVVESFTQEINNYTCHFNYVLNTHDITINSIESLHSLLESKGIHIFENPIEKPIFPTQHRLKNMHKKGYGENDLISLKYDMHQYDLAEEKTFYNPYIFKL